MQHARAHVLRALRLGVRQQARQVEQVVVLVAVSRNARDNAPSNCADGCGPRACSNRE